MEEEGSGEDEIEILSQPLVYGLEKLKAAREEETVQFF